MRTSSLMATTLLCLASCLAPQSDPDDPVDDPTAVWPDRPERPEDSGRVTLRRLTNDEYNNTVRDLLLTELRPADRFPADDRAHGWDNMADAQTLSPLHLDMYFQAAQDLVATEFANPIVPEREWFYEAESDMEATTGGASSYYYNLWSRGSVTGSLTATDAGTYTLTVSLAATQGGPDNARASLLIDGASVRDVEVIGERSWQEFDVDVELEPGFHTVGVAFLNDFYDPDAGEDRNLWVDWVQLEGPMGLSGEPTAARARYYTCDPEVAGEDPCAREILTGFAERAWRAPVTEDDLASVLAVYDDGVALEATWEQSVQAGLVASLLSPRFLFRLELDPNPTDGTTRELNAHELATRLSYFLWRSMPDDELRLLAADGTLLQEDVLRAQVSRMLRDPKAAAVVDDFAGQWLEIRAIANVEPDYETFPDWDDQLRVSMQEEMRLFAESILLDDRSMLDLLTDDTTYVDARLADHYGVPAPSGGGFGPVSITEHPRIGLFGKAGLLTNLAFPKRTSVTRRGAWVMSNLLCEAPPPAPEGVLELPNPDLSLRERMEKHREDPACATCHKVMDPIGFSMENYDGIGSWRTIDELGNDVDASGSWPGGPTFDNARQLAIALAGDSRIPGCMAQNAFTYAMGRPGNVEDLPFIDDIQGDFVSGRHRFEALATAIVLSPPFRQRRGESEEGR